jgi:hypothetical protein
MDIGQLDYKIPGQFNLGGMIANQQAIAGEDIKQQANALQIESAQQEMQAKNQQRQRDVQAQGIYRSSLDQTGKLDEGKYLSSLNQSGMSDYAQKYQADVAKRVLDINHAEYLKTQKDSMTQTDLLTKAQAQASNVYSGLQNLYIHYPEFQKAEALRAGTLNPQQMDAYKVFFDTASKEGIGAMIDTPEQFLANPSMAMQKAQSVGQEAQQRLKEALDKSTMWHSRYENADITAKNTGWYTDPETGVRSKVPKEASPGALMLGVRQDQRLEDKLTLMGKDLDYSRVVRSSFGIAGLGYERAERLETLATSFENGDAIRDAEMEELAMGMAQLVGGTAGAARSQVEALVPKTARGSAQKIKQWFLNEPQGLNQKKFVDRIMGSITREKETMGDQLQRQRYRRMANWDYLREKAPEEWASIAESNGVNVEDYDAWVKSGHKQFSAVQVPEGGGLSPREKAIGKTEPATEKKAEENLPTYTPEQVKALGPGTYHFKGTTGKVYTITKK